MTENLAPPPDGVVLACPVCGEPLPRNTRTVRCVNAHTFDVAKEGYVNLLLAQRRRSRDPGYSKEMIAARRDFFDGGHYQPLADDIADAVISYLPRTGERVVLGAGCGEGYYLRRLRQRLAETDHERETVRCGLDVSKHGIRVAASRDPSGMYAVANTYRMPVLSSRVDVLLTHFSPVSAADFRRVVRPGGVVLVSGPGENHLFSLKELLYDTPAPDDPTDALADQTGFQLITTHRIRYKLALRGPGQVANLLAMTPFYWSVDQATHNRHAAMEAFDTEIDIVVYAYRRTADVTGGVEPWRTPAGPRYPAEERR